MFKLNNIDILICDGRNMCENGTQKRSIETTEIIYDL